MATVLDARDMVQRNQGSENINVCADLTNLKLREHLESLVKGTIDDAGRSWRQFREGHEHFPTSASRLELSPLKATYSSSLALREDPVSLGGDFIFFDSEFYALENQDLTRPFRRPGKIEFLWTELTSETEASDGVSHLRSTAQEFVDRHNADPDDIWSFWRNWYQGFLNEIPLNWELQRRVALIADDIWEAGPAAVAEEIARIEAAYEVEKRASELEESAYPHSDLRSVRGMGDNNPPSPIDDALKTSDGVTIIWAAAHELKEEAQAAKPDKARIEKALGAILGVLKACGLWAAKKVDSGLQAAVIAAGGAGGVAGVGWITQNSDEIVGLVEAVQKWLPFLQ
ncbi:hypothetical protein [Roseovarius aestuariivivens]|uniref:hypothetical protein n=1 Tax=Roseovarius aestuariivivens TaxID=1888910 RepID=UPI0010816F32|nr:hypothetical protein [Roseovarius aestuariivivens]